MIENEGTLEDNIPVMIGAKATRSMQSTMGMNQMNNEVVRNHYSSIIAIWDRRLARMASVMMKKSLRFMKLQISNQILIYAIPAESTTSIITKPMCGMPVRNMI